MTRIAFLGLGAMGSRMALNLLKAGFDVTVWNRTPERTEALAGQGAGVALSPRDAATGADIVIAMVRDNEASRAVWLDPETGAAEGMGRDAVAIECSTLTVGWVQSLSETLSGMGIAFLDAPLAGSRPQAEAAQLIFLVGGNTEPVERVRPALDAMGSAIHHAGGTGAGAAVKLAVNSLFGIQVAAIAELMGMLAKAGVDTARAAEIIGATPVASLAAKGAMASMLSGNFAPMFPVELVEKDFGYIQGETARLGGSSPMADSARTVMQQAMSAGLGNDNLTGIVRLYD